MKENIQYYIEKKKVINQSVISLVNNNYAINISEISKRLNKKPHFVAKVINNLVDLDSLTTKKMPNNTIHVFPVNFNEKNMDEEIEKRKQRSIKETRKIKSEKRQTKIIDLITDKPGFTPKNIATKLKDSIYPIKAEIYKMISDKLIIGIPYTSLSIINRWSKIFLFSNDFISEKEIQEITDETKQKMTIEIIERQKEMKNLKNQKKALLEKNIIKLESYQKNIYR